MNTTGPRSGTATTTTTGMNVQRITARLRIIARRTDTRRTATISRLFPIPTLSQQLPVQPRRSIIAPAYGGAKGTETFENGDALGHSWGSWQSNGDDTHTRTCQICAVKETENCTGGTATCVNKAICSVCNAEHGAVDPTNHTGTEAWITTDTMHTKVWRCCQAVNRS